MLIRRSAGVLAAVLLIGLAPPLTSQSRADPARPVVQMTYDFVLAEHVSRGASVKVALLSDGVATGLTSLRRRTSKEKDFVGTSRPIRLIGTLMASLILGATPPGRSSTSSSTRRGLAPGVTILPVRVYPEPVEPGGRRWAKTANWDEHLARGIRYAVDHGAGVIAADLPGYEDESTSGLGAAVAYAQAKNVVILALTDRDGASPYPPYPVSIPGVIGVGAVTSRGRVDPYTASGSSAAFVSAPGYAVTAVNPRGRPWVFSGGPVALSFATAAVAMIRSAYPKLTPAQVGQALSASARRRRGTGRYDSTLGFGYLNAIGALERARVLAGKPAPAVTARSSVPDGDGLGGDRPGTISAVPHDPIRLGGFGALAYAGLVALGFAIWLALRRRTRAPATGGGS